jgi:peptidoglycan/xylan/chitin deacetylase (PgdA/CDA1 family)
LGRSADGKLDELGEPQGIAVAPVLIITLMHSVLVYHTISAPVEPLEADADISPAKFERHLQWLSRWRQVVSLEDTLDAPTGRNLVAITFDDGYQDNLTVALPLLEKFQLPMTIFVTAGFLGRDTYLSESELRELSQHPLVTVGAHGLWHRHFNRLTRSDARFELTESRRLLSSITGKPVDLLAWPFGECNEKLEQLSADCGYRASWSVWKGTNSAHSRWRVPLGRNDHLARFVIKSSGAYALTKAKWHRRNQEAGADGSSRWQEQALGGRRLRSEIRGQKSEVRSERSEFRANGIFGF